MNTVGKGRTSLVMMKKNLRTMPKVHFIMDHFSDYFEDPLTGGEGLGTTTYQIIEQIKSIKVD